MHILMYGWEYPPMFNGGLGIACQGMAKALSAKGHEVTFILPKIQNIEKNDPTHLVDVSELPEESLITTKKAFDITYHEIGSKLMPYLSVKDFRNYASKTKEEAVKKPTKQPSGTKQEISLLKRIRLTGEYNADIMAEMTKYAVMSTTVLKDKKFDVIHAHDWMSFKAGLIAKKLLKIPLIVHIHSTEWDRNGAFVNPEVEKIEKEGFNKSDHIIAVSDRVKKQLIENYKISESKITVIPNGIDSKEFPKTTLGQRKSKNIGFIGRLVDQKGPQKFIDIARDLSSKIVDTHYMLAGIGYLENDLNHKIETQNLKKQVEQLGFLNREEIKNLLKKLDLLIVPSISEPFGLVALEGVAAKVPVLVSSHAGILEHVALKNADYWNVHEFSKIGEELLTNPKSAKSYVESTFKDLKKLEWNKLIDSTLKVYKSSLKKSK